MAQQHEIQFPLAVVHFARRVATSKENGGLGIIDLETHALAMCAKMLVSLTIEQQSWAKMAIECLKLAKLTS